jgi:hypothetical protein
MPAAEVQAHQINLRVTYEEEAAIHAACEALGSGLTQSGLVQLAVFQALTDLGMLLGDDAPPRLKPEYSYPFVPQRPDGESARARVTVYVVDFTYPTLVTAAWALRISVPMLVIGATLRYVALLRLINERRQRAEPKKYNPALAKLSVPYDFDELVRSTRR